MTTPAPRSDRSERVLALVLRWLPADRAEWGDAMLGELDAIAVPRERRRFAAGCARVAVTAPWAREAPGRSIVVAMELGATACIGTVGLSLLQYPGLVTGWTWLDILIFLGLVGCYVLAGATLVRRLQPESRGHVRVAMTGTIGLAALWVAIGGVASYAPSKTASTALMLALPVVAFAIGAVSTRQGGSARNGRRASLLAGIGAGLLGFTIWMSDTLLMSGRPYDSGMRRDFATSGARDLATYAVSDNLGSAMMLLILIPLLTAAFGAAGAATMTAFHRR